MTGEPEAPVYTEPGEGNPDVWAQQELEARQKITDAIDAIGALNTAIAPLEATKKPLVEQVKQSLLLRADELVPEKGYVYGTAYMAHIQSKGSAGSVNLKDLYHADGGPNMLRQLLELGLLRLDVTGFKAHHKANPTTWSAFVNRVIVPGAGTEALIVEPKKA